MAYSGTYSSSAVYPQEWAAKVQERLNKPQTWKECCNVIYSDKYIINVPYLSTEAAAASHTRGTAYTYPDNVITTDTLTISSSYVRAIYTDRADLAQCTLFDRMEQADRQASQLNEVLESAFLGTYSGLTDFGDTGGGAMGLGSSAISITSSNIDKVIRGVKREIITANGLELMNRHGIFFVWRPADFECLENFCQANGYTMADRTLESGIPQAFYALGAYHYVSNSHTANHVVAGVRNLIMLGVLKSTYGQVVVNDDPALLSGIGMVARVDYGTNPPEGLKSILFDVNVA